MKKLLTVLSCVFDRIFSVSDSGKMHQGPEAYEYVSFRRYRA